MNEPERYLSHVVIYKRIAQENKLIADFSPTPPSTGILDRIDAIRYFLLTRMGESTAARFMGPQILIYRVTPRPEVP